MKQVDQGEIDYSEKMSEQSRLLRLCVELASSRRTKQDNREISGLRVQSYPISHREGGPIGCKGRLGDGRWELRCLREAERGPTIEIPEKLSERVVPVISLRGCAQESGWEALCSKASKYLSRRLTETGGGVYAAGLGSRTLSVMWEK